MGTKQTKDSCLQGTDQQDEISVDGEIDRIYVKAPDQLKVSLLLLHQLSPAHSLASIYGRVSSRNH